MPKLLEQLTATPLEKICESDWERMRGAGNVRHCESCARDVYAISEMTALEAEIRLLNAGDAAPCIRYLRDESGNVVHRAPPRVLHSPTRALAMASAFGVAIAPAAAAAKKAAKAPAQCVVLTAADELVAAADAAPLPAAAPAAPAARPAQAPPASAARAAAAPASPPSPSPSPPPLPMAGVPPMPRQPVLFGFLAIESKTPRDVKIAGLTLHAPLPSYRLTPGDFTVEFVDAKGKTKKKKFKITNQKKTIVSLD